MEQDIQLHHTAQFACLGRNIIWMFQGDQDLPLNARRGNYGSVYIHKVEIYNDGYYECKGEYNSMGGLSFYGLSRLNVFGKCDYDL